MSGLSEGRWGRSGRSGVESLEASIAASEPVTRAGSESVHQQERLPARQQGHSAAVCTPGSLVSTVRGISRSPGAAAGRTGLEKGRGRLHARRPTFGIRRPRDYRSNDVIMRAARSTHSQLPARRAGRARSPQSPAGAQPTSLLPSHHLLLTPTSTPQTNPNPPFQHVQHRQRESPSPSVFPNELEGE